MILKKGIIYRYEKDYSTNKKLTKERYDLLKSIENELLKEGRKNFGKRDKGVKKWKKK